MTVVGVVLVAAVSREDAAAAVIGIGAVAVALVAIATAVKVFSGYRWIRWLGRTFIGDPIGGAVRRLVRSTLDDWAADDGGVYDRLEKLEAQHRRNGGSSTLDRIEAIAEVVGAKPPPDEPPGGVHPF